MGDDETPLYDFIEAGRVASSASYLSFADGKQDGKVRVKYPNGDMYIGTYKQIGSSIRREGHGAYTWNTEDADDGEGGAPTQSRYEGQYARGLRHGIGTMTYTNGDFYRGRFVLNKRHGSGTLTSAATGDVYSGNWVSDKREGHGAYVFAKNGDQLVGEWRGGSPTSWCKWLLGDGTVMTLDAASGATFKGSAPLGAASFTFVSGFQQNGAFTAEDPEADASELALTFESKTTTVAAVAGTSLVAMPDAAQAAAAHRPLVICAPVGIGQDAAVSALQAASDAFALVTLHTSRAPGAGEESGARYAFVSAEDIGALKEEGKLAESHEYDGKTHGTSVEAINAARSAGKIGVIATDLNGCRALKQSGLDALYVFVAPSAAKLEELFAAPAAASKEGGEEEEEEAAAAAAAEAEARQARLDLATEEIAAAGESVEVGGGEVPLFTEHVASDDAAVILEDVLDAVRVHITPV